MKSVTACVLFLLVAGLTGCATAPPTVSAGDTADTITYEVYGMDCPGCHGGVEKNLKKIPGVADAAANWKEKTIVLTLAPDEEVSHAAVEQAVKDSNFSLGKRID
ncbi:MAG: heavy-metal-associated domain-containing protein [Lentisphaerae bacterium]|nr:heavy-metal-associated domain-containing protein [Lentisphaerota bacterium]